MMWNRFGNPRIEKSGIRIFFLDHKTDSLGFGRRLQGVAIIERYLIQNNEAGASLRHFDASILAKL